MSEARRTGDPRIKYDIHIASFSQVLSAIERMNASASEWLRS